MGAWGTGPLENDGALDWIDELSDGGLDFAAFREGCDAELDEGFISEHADGVLALVRVARILDGESEEDGLDEDIDRNALAAGLTPEFRLWLVEAGQKVINAEGSVAAAGDAVGRNELLAADAIWSHERKGLKAVRLLCMTHFACRRQSGPVGRRPACG